MNSKDRTRLTLEERMALAAQSRASSPEAAAALVRRFSHLPAAYVFCGKSDIDAMYDLIGEFLDDPRVEVETYRGFCPAYQLAMDQDNDRTPVYDQQRPDPLLPVFGHRMNNALIHLGEMVLDQAMGRYHHKEVFQCLRMTLGQYLEALAGPDFRRSEAEAEWFAVWRDRLLREIDGDLPLAEAQAGILRRYMAGWASYDRLDHLLLYLAGLALQVEDAGTRCDLSPCPDSDADQGDASLFLEFYRTEEAEAAWRLRMDLRRFGIGRDPSDLPQADPSCEDPYGYFLDLARNYAPDLPDPGAETGPGALRENIFLPDWHYGPALLYTLIRELPFPEFVPLWQETLDREKLSQAMTSINSAVTDLYMLWVEPYLRLKK